MNIYIYIIQVGESQYPKEEKKHKKSPKTKKKVENDNIENETTNLKEDKIEL